MYLKIPHFRSKKLTDLAKGKPCMCCGADDGTTVSAHANSSIWGKGKGIKAHDFAIAFLCFKCHTQLDQGGMSREDADAMWLHAHVRTMQYLFTHHLEIKL